ncbi:nuclear transport factor 2 family protein [Sphingomonas profundi]|uniref:nuclear transport factor 2 family protein n=1 Tax=Alterirhizorhabdus profundi TaxID=2681549 RepID=UPI0012E74160|nr:nuclear transport factor 2 family protein [Sphingomonas profundi]
MTDAAAPDATRMAEIVRELYALTSVGNWDAAEEYFTEDFRIVECESLPYGGLFTGKQAMRNLFPHVMGFWSDPEVELAGVSAGDGFAYGIVTLHVTSRKTGRRYPIEIAERFEFRGEQVCEVKPYYFDTHLIHMDAKGEPIDA